MIFFYLDKISFTEHKLIQLIFIFFGKIALGIFLVIVIDKIIKYGKRNISDHWQFSQIFWEILHEIKNDSCWFRLWTKIVSN